MRIPLSPLAFGLLACTGPQRALPAPDWAKAATAFVEAPSRVPAMGAWADPDPERDKAAIKAAVEDDLRSAGMRIVELPDSKGALYVAIGGFDGAQGENSTLTVTVDRDGANVDQFTLMPAKLACLTSFTLVADVTQCIGREIAVHVLESRRVAQASSRRAPAPAAAVAVALSGKLAVLELRNFTQDLTRENAQYFTDVVRSAALKTQPQVEVMTRENLMVLLKASGKSLDDCEGECEVDTGRRIGADEIVSGEIQKLGSLYKVSLRLHDTRAGRLLSSAQASGKSIEELDQNAQAAALQLLGAPAADSR